MQQPCNPRHRQIPPFLDFASADHEAGAQALLKGAQSRTAPSFLIHTSGTGILEFPDLERSNYGEADLSSWDDIADISKLVNDIPDWAPHRNVDKIILDANTNLVKTAIVCPPTIYGSSRGPGNTRSIQIPILTQKMLERGQGFQVGRGLAHWTHVHVHDLSSAYLLLAEAAAAGGGNASWGREGYYFTENGEHVWKDVSEAIAGRLHAQGALKSDAIVSVTADEASEMHPAGKYLWGANSLGRASRARKQLAWKPKAESLVASLDATIAEEARMFEKGKLVKDRT